MNPQRSAVQQDAPDSYDKDFFLWTERVAALLRERRWEEVDVEHVAEEIESLGRRDRRELHSRLRVLVKHLLKWQAQPERRQGGTWRATIETQRHHLLLVLKDSPSLRTAAAEALSEEFARARESARRESRLPAYSWPDTCPFTLDQVLDDSFYPGGETEQ